MGSLANFVFVSSLLLYIEESSSERPSILRAGIFVLAVIESVLYMSAAA